MAPEFADQDRDLTYVGRSLSRVDAPGKVTGETRFLSDLYLDRMVYAYPVVSTIPFGRIVRIDDRPARRLAGFIAAYWAGDVPGENRVGVILDDQPLLADTVVRYVGDTIGLVVAETYAAARRIAAAVKVEYEPYDPYLSIEASKAARDRFIHDTNIACEHRSLKGDVDRGLAQSDLVVEATFVTPYQEHYYLEPQGCIAVPEADGGMTVYGSLQCPFYVQKAVARNLGVPYSKVRVIQAPTGGAFGGKEDVPSEVCARAALAARRLNRPVKLVYHRRDDVQMTSKRHPFQMRYKVGVTREGRLVAADITLEENAGAYATLSSVVSYRATMQAMGPYVIPNARVISTSYYTNLPPTGAFRGFGSPQAAFGHERIMDLIAHRLGLDPLELRLKNVLREDDVTLTGQHLKVSVGAQATLRRVRAVSHWDRRRKEAGTNGRYRRGIGVATCIYGNCLGAAGWSLDGAAVKIQIHRDGSITVAYGLTEMGQGALTVVVQMTAEALGVNPGRVTVLPTDSQQVPDSGPSVASRNVVMTGNAIREAAAKLLPVLRAAAAELLACKPEQVEFRDDHARDRTTGNAVPFTDLAEHLYLTNRPMDTLGWWHVPSLEYDPERGQGEAYFTYSYAAHVAQVRVDTVTGQVQVEKIWAAHDVGRAVNPAGIEGQVEGGTAQGTGWALTEDFQLQDGRVLTANLSTYLLPTTLDVGEVETIIVEDPEPQGPWGAKGIGEPAIIPVGAAIANAVSQAIGVQVREIPLTPERVLALLDRQTAAGTE
jgi:CO/xanthine dehydrogenase Mo-binding subunit